MSDLELGCGLRIRTETVRTNMRTIHSLHLAVLSAITLFLGGWSAPFSFLTWVPSYLWFFLKLLAITCGFIWIRGTLPRLRMDQLMHFAWKFMLPMTLLNIFAAAAWKFLPLGIVRWLACAVFLAVAFVLLTRNLKKRGDIYTRQYRFAE